MRKLVSHLILTLDGVAVFDTVADMVVKLRDTEEVLSDFFAKVAEEDAMLLGRTTYQEWADYWPSSKVEPFASHINNVPKYVVSNTLQATPWGADGKATLLKGDLAETVAALKRQPGKNIGVHGSPTLVEALLHAGLLDELRLEIYPVVAGCGARLFGEERPIKQLQLSVSKITNNGVAILTYTPSTANTAA
jgi:dihydrofolate reductase